MLQYKVTITPEPADPNLIVVINDSLLQVIQVTTGTDLIYFGGNAQTGTYIPGQYVVEVRTWSTNDVDTGVFVELFVDILDPCESANLAIDVNNEVFLDPPATTITQYANYGPIGVTWNDAIVTSSYNSATNLCGAFVHELYDVTSGIP